MARDFILFKRLAGIISHAQLASGTPVSGYVPIASSGVAGDSPAWGPASGVADILDLPTAETDATLVLAPDGAGGVEFRAESGGGGGGLTPLYTDSGAQAIRFPDDESYFKLAQGDVGDGSDSWVKLDAGDVQIVGTDGSKFPQLALNGSSNGNAALTADGTGSVVLTAPSAGRHSLFGGKGVLFPTLASDPSSPSEGQVYYNTVSHVLKCWDGSAWQNLF